ncbi:HDOD domain-containing protein [Pelagicoccus sp. SDUM812003]|uniref:HDOD domain-containing protein n=1 Tax=Pelagicoccus sp. SDUM812003 TaxID=3041267 RepID=UPI0028107721|nr:HDOD domain-containing protein [Pelagicoccus sp. SDUM812003]MDQ8202606.1 HDOD domain-containing protein [Pelagicoccus sp. SDUM812003]
MFSEFEERFNQAIELIGDLHGNMAVLSRIDGLLKDYNSNLSEIETLIESDGAIAGSIIKISNSVLYGLAQPNDSVGEALQTVGFDQALKLVSMALSKQVFMRDLDAYGVSANDYWRQSYFTAIFMENEAKRFGLEESDAYLLGLLHGIGRVVINELLHVNEVEVFWDRYLPLSQWERSMVGFTNEIAGSLLLKNWEFSTAVYGRIGNQFRKEEIAKDTLLAMLHYTRQMSLNVDDEQRLRDYLVPENHFYLRRTRSTRAQIKGAVRKAREEMNAVYESIRDC